MIPASFDYVRANTVDEALTALDEHGEDAKLLAGGHSLLPLMKYRLAAPAVLIDIGKLKALQYISDAGDHVAIGALTRHHDVERSTLVAQNTPLLGKVSSMVGDPQVRHRGTIGGSISHGDPASDLPSALLAMRATLVATGPDGEREIPIDDFFTSFLETALTPGELLTEIRVSKVPDKGWSFRKFNLRSQDWAVVGASIQMNNGSSGVGLVNMHSTPARAAAVEAAIVSGASASEAAAVAADGMEPPSDEAGTGEYRTALAKVLVEDGIREAAG